MPLFRLSWNPQPKELQVWFYQHVSKSKHIYIHIDTRITPKANQDDCHPPLSLRAADPIPPSLQNTETLHSRKQRDLIRSASSNLTRFLVRDGDWRCMFSGGRARLSSDQHGGYGSWTRVGGVRACGWFGWFGRWGIFIILLLSYFHHVWCGLTVAKFKRRIYQISSSISSQQLSLPAAVCCQQRGGNQAQVFQATDHDQNTRAEPSQLEHGKCSQAASKKENPAIGVSKTGPIPCARILIQAPTRSMKHICVRGRIQGTIPVTWNMRPDLIAFPCDQWAVTHIPVSLWQWQLTFSTNVDWKRYKMV